MARPWGSGRRTVEQSRCIDISALHHAGYFERPRGGIWKWHDHTGRLTAFVFFNVEKFVVTLRWPHRGADGKMGVDQQRIRIGWHPCRFGGYRPFFVCSCRRDVLSLYAAGSRFACRHCFNLTYATRQATPRDRHILKAQRLRLRLGGSANLADAFPDRPRYMHRNKYEGLRERTEQAEEQGAAMLALRLMNLARRR